MACIYTPAHSTPVSPSLPLTAKPAPRHSCCGQRAHGSSGEVGEGQQIGWNSGCGVGPRRVRGKAREEWVGRREVAECSQLR
ncbi:hypothetical protein CC85DRAFT_284771 [Cutaneotrichosporon oleaginosum]|uniref:Uncharacterized protein n=1 Tax=Cutaneotrichosporon oleaginosum TaxID=879819 RepID=A0A0J0XQ38_9TREE|nr:uncharacterized protein CC85DRAFT_284771 [Cutaneotrichosporon oleaginosum]KLT43213.1 hypothetical protein CC85DRAFT_284771 [Cutaneotrichosporon oleaginosum]TXT09895.1 hypothetical protein COLE_03829 [Cutaneotrichosporon oleaginosum]